MEMEIEYSSESGEDSSEEEYEPYSFGGGAYEQEV